LKANPVSAASDADTKEEIANPLTGYIHIAPDNKVTVLSSQFDMGQGPYHGLATLVVEELGADWSQIDVQGAAGNPKLYGNLLWGGAIQGTGGSTSMATSFDRYRQAGAVAREMLVAAAAAEWDVPGAEIKAAGGRLSHSTGESASFGDLAAKAATMPVPQDVPLKPQSAWTEIGNADRRRFDSPPKANGTHQFTIDLKLDGMLTAVVAHPPKFGGKVKAFDAADALKVRGVSDVVEIHRGVAVVADNMWSAIKGREALKVTWDEDGAETGSSVDMLADYRSKADQAPQAMARVEGDTAKALASAAKVIDATYEFPFLAHAAMEPLNAVARRNADGTLEVWGGHQMPDVYQAISAQIAGVKPEQVTMHVMKTGGGFGRRAVIDGDVVSEAVAVAKAIGFKAPVKVQWTREDDMRGGRYRPAYVHHFKAGLDADGKLVAWHNHIVGQSIITGTPFEKGFVKDGVDATSVEGASNIPYGIPNISVGLTTSDVKVPVLWWRAVGSTHTAYAVETFLDEVIAAAGKDPYQFRMELLADHPRHAGVLKLAAEKAGWQSPAPAGRFRGLAVHESFNTVVAHIAEVSMEDGEPKVRKVTVAVDCGIAVNPDTIRAQMEGGTGFGLGSIMAEELTLVNGEVDQGNYDTYTPLRIDAMPDIEVHIVPSGNAPTGVGEPGVPSIGPAVANAIAAASGRRIRVLPMSKSFGA
ncbi:MAG: xanthine dehydrogenase family protein molybdopterin-binding subunit, partial [Rhizobiales bacterium]|nr:xanthine dehydrogenase family protein molybdopterin-binding subunit [Hyphomicrobiales bacterium]